jgi:hypothetical protein
VLPQTFRRSVPRLRPSPEPLARHLTNSACRIKQCAIPMLSARIWEQMEGSTRTPGLRDRVEASGAVLVRALPLV